jgi:hypothetical protein
MLRSSAGSDLYKSFMKKFILIFLFANVCIVAYNQVIKGTVLENKTNSPIIATIYFNGTFVGTQSDANGNFELDISKNASMPLTISSVGYYSVTMNDVLTQKPLIIYMSPKVHEVKEVVISSKSLAKRRIANLNLFKKVFLGSSNYARNCIILNENDISFNYDTDRDTLKAFASKPLLIDNKSLGYNMTYYLDRFEYSKKDGSMFFAGSLIFNKDLAIDKSSKKIYGIKRKIDYYGSRMHFIRALWADDLVSEGFSIYNSDGQFLNYKDIVEESVPDSLNNPTKFLIYSKPLSIYYDSRLTKMSLLKKNVYFDKDGYFDQTGMGVSWEGEMMNRRVGDMLPYTYKPENL